MGNIQKKTKKTEYRKLAEKMKGLKRPVSFQKEGRWKERDREKKAPRHISGAITVGNGSHLSHLDISGDL